VESAARDRRARSVAEELTREGTRVRFAGSIHVSEDELCFFTFEAPSSRVSSSNERRVMSTKLAVLAVLVAAVTLTSVAAAGPDAAKQRVAITVTMLNAGGRVR